jgi:adenylate cyclase
VVVCVLPFVNMSGDAEQEYFSDGISEDVITDLSKVSALSIVGRNTAFSFKGKSLDIAALRRDLGVTHVLEGSVRKAGQRVRINAQMIDCASGHQVWAERYDRDLTDIFAIQDEISKAIVAALQVKLLPREKKAIEARGTSNPEAYNLYLLARQQWINGNRGDRRRDEVIVRVCRQAVTIDPNYAQAWALMALAQCELRFRHILNEDAMPAAERALALDPNIAEAYCVRARYFQDERRYDEANAALDTALALDPDSWEVNKECAQLTFRQGRLADSARYFEKSMALMESDFHAPSLLVTLYEALGDKQRVLEVARIAVTRGEKAIAQDGNNGFALGHLALALAALGDAARAKECVARAILVDPDNLLTRYNLACALTLYLNDQDGAIELLGPYFERVGLTQLKHADVDPDMDKLRDDPRYRAMTDAALERLGATWDEMPGQRMRAGQAATG